MNFHYSMIEAGGEAPAEETPTVDYYAGAKRVTRNGVPCRVFQWRSRELSAQIASIEIAAAAGCPVDLADAPRFLFIPAERGNSQAVKHKVAALVSKPSAMMRDYYKGGARVTVGGVPCRLARPLAKNHSTRHWASLSEPMQNWQERAAAWWKGVQEARDVAPAAVQMVAEEPEEPAPTAIAEDPAPEHDAPAYLVRTLSEEGRVDRPFATLREAVEEVAAMYLRREWASIYSSGLSENFSLHPHAGRNPPKPGAKPFRWSCNFESCDGYKSAPCFAAERAGVRYVSRRQGYQASNRAVRAFAAEWDAKMSEQEAAPEPVEAQEPVSAISLPQPIADALTGPEIAHATPAEPADDPVAEIQARLDALESQLATLSAKSVDAPISGKRERSPAHERAVRRAWTERKARREAEKHLRWGQIQYDGVKAERDEMARDNQRIPQLQAALLRSGEANEALQRKRRANALLARQRTREMVAAVNLMHAQADGLRDDLDTARRSPTYFDADGAERIDLIGRSAYHARLALERAERAEQALSAVSARCERAEKARDMLADKFDGMVSRLAKAEAAVRKLAAA